MPMYVPDDQPVLRAMSVALEAIGEDDSTSIAFNSCVAFRHRRKRTVVEFDCGFDWDSPLRFA